jgi:hypothetical protein
LFSEDLFEFGEFCRQKNAPVLAVYDVGDLEAIKKYNSIEIDHQGRITFFEEKPAQPKSTLTGIALYYYPESCLAMIQQYIAEGNNPDQPGRLGPVDVQSCSFLHVDCAGALVRCGVKRDFGRSGQSLFKIAE